MKFLGVFVMKTLVGKIKFRLYFLCQYNTLNFQNIHTIKIISFMYSIQNKLAPFKFQNACKNSNDY